ncbi:hypothetical protein C0Q70_09570 [Pomacea canaliculata]|uniref:CARD domain-containing protein n=1 Tax=Pomacea canaliculata TaxID=400727 RepID=A0A2T7PA72_POMCA|nr:golgin subfamily A member 6-like protein 2 [Pomacea canaliculata]PVD30306.1 hypothetical protein C0Q70_09570 [Pomacea canaliculata]
MAQHKFPRFPRGRLSQKLRDCLQQNTAFLEENLDAPHIVTKLYSTMILDDEDRDAILGPEGTSSTRQQQNRRLLSKLTMRADDGFRAFLQALKDTGHEAASRKIQEWLRRNTAALPGQKVDAQNDSLAATDFQFPETEMTTSTNQTVLYRRVIHVENRLDVLSTRLTRLDTASSQQQTQEAEDLRKRFENAKEEIENLKQLLTYKSLDLEKAQAEIHILEERILKLNDEQRELEDKLKVQEQKLNDQETKINNQESRMKDQETRLKSQESRLKEQEIKMKSQETKFKEQLHNAEIKLTEEMKKQHQQHNKIVSKLCADVRSLIENQRRISQEQQVQNKESLGGAGKDVQTKTTSKVMLQNAAAHQTYKQIRPAPAKVNRSQDNTQKKK